jgi:hypothetical protein
MQCCVVPSLQDPPLRSSTDPSDPMSFQIVQTFGSFCCRKEFVVNLDKEGRIPRNTYSPPLKVSPGYLTEMTGQSTVHDVQDGTDSNLSKKRR